MASRSLEWPGEVGRALRQAIETAIPDAQVHVMSGNPRHFTLRVISPSFAGQSLVEQQQRVYAAIKELMQGDDAPVHAIDRLHTSTG